MRCAKRFLGASSHVSTRVSSRMAKAVIFGCEGLELTTDERAFFNEQQPLGFILFKRNIDSPEQVKALVQDLKSTVGHDNVPVLIDQEGGRVARLTPPHWPTFPPAEDFVNLAGHDLPMAIRACQLNAQAIAYELTQLGINTNCAPVADLRNKGAHDIIGDRAFGKDPMRVVALAGAQAQGLMDGGVMPVLKHIPGHGRALVDSHEDLPIVDADLPTLIRNDFMPFQMLADLPMGMTAHVRYDAIDAEQVATLSPKAIDTIRNRIGFDGLLMTDDMSMKALVGDIGANAKAAIDAGCDIALHCNGKMDEMQQIAGHVAELNAEASRRAHAAFATIENVEPLNVEAIDAELKSLLYVSLSA